MYQIWISPAANIDYFLVETFDTRSAADTSVVSWARAGYFTTVRMSNVFQ